MIHFVVVVGFLGGGGVCFGLVISNLWCLLCAPNAMLGLEDTRLERRELLSFVVDRWLRKVRKYMSI